MNSDELVYSLLRAVRKVIETFEEYGIRRSLNEKLNDEKLFKSVVETTESKMEPSINPAMNKVFPET